MKVDRSDGPMRADASGDVGEVGESAAATEFMRIGWPATRTTAIQDLGTDQLILARDRRFDRGEFVGAQVKSGSSNLDEPIRENGKHVGWWVRVDGRHVDYWLGNALPHLLVLYDHERRRCHWVHLTSNTITRTGAGAKVRVPVAHVVTEGQLGALLAVAATTRSAVPLEGTAWTGGSPAADTDLLRFALIAPRLIAPHPNSGVAPCTPAEVIALILQARVERAWPPGRHHPAVPARDAARSHHVWAWRFAAALADWLIADRAPDFESLLGATAKPHERAAAAVVLAHRAIAQGEPDVARRILEREIADDHVAPVDHAWLHLQLARAWHELAEVGAARDSAARALAIGATQPHDVTATAIRGIAAAILFNTSPLGDGDLATLVQHGDTAVAWWRSATAHRGLNALVESVFDRGIGLSATEINAQIANNELLAASTQAGLLGSQGQWRHYLGLLARQQLIDADGTDAETIADGLKDLHRAGDEKTSRKSVQWFVANGPAHAVAEVARAIDLRRATSTTFLTGLAMLGAGGDVLEDATATAAADWLMTALDDSTRLKALSGRSYFDPAQRIAQELAGILQAIPVYGAELAVGAIERHGADFATLAAQDWSRVLMSIPRWAWTREQTDRLRAAVISDHEHGRLQAAIRSVRLAFVPEERDALIARVAAGGLASVAYLDSLDVLAPNELETLRAAFAARVADDRHAAHDAGLTRYADVDPLTWLAAIILRRPDADEWELLCETLADPALPIDSRSGAISLLALEWERIDAAARPALLTAIERAGEQPTLPFEDTDITGVVTYARCVLGDLNRAPAAVAQLARGDADRRSWAARLAAETAQHGALTILSADGAPTVRAEAARGLAQYLADGGVASEAQTALALTVADRGRATGLAVAAVIAEHMDVAALSEIRTQLAAHPSASVRRLISSR